MNSEKTTRRETKKSTQSTNSFEKPFVSAKIADTFSSHIISRDLRHFENSPGSKIVGTDEEPKSTNTTHHPRISW